VTAVARLRASFDPNRNPESAAPVGYLAIATCPNPDGGNAFSATPIGSAGATCAHCGELMMVVDALRAHETFTEHGSNQEMCSRVLSVAERLASLALLIHLRERRPSAVGAMAFITDGPLALFGEVAPIKRPLLRKLQLIAAEQRKQGSGVPIVFGLEKSGFFAEHGQVNTSSVTSRSAGVPMARTPTMGGTSSIGHSAASCTRSQCRRSAAWASKRTRRSMSPTIRHCATRASF
jgi:hypothetical protein